MRPCHEFDSGDGNQWLLWMNDRFDCFTTGGRFIIWCSKPARLYWLGLLDQDGGLLCKLNSKISFDGSMMNWNNQSIVLPFET